MGHHNLAIAVAPLLIRPEIETIETMVEHGHAVQTLISTLIENYELLFGKVSVIYYFSLFLMLFIFYFLKSYNKNKYHYHLKLLILLFKFFKKLKKL